MKTTIAGRRAEAEVSRWLQNRGYEIISQNWRTSRCEIDIVASKNKIVYFVEVKYRGHDSQGDGFEYVTPRKLRQMQFAAQVWNQQNNWNGDWRLIAASVAGDDFKVVELVELD